jgi:hypothetical protein
LKKTPAFGFRPVVAVVETVTQTHRRGDARPASAVMIGEEFAACVPKSISRWSMR